MSDTEYSRSGAWASPAGPSNDDPGFVTPEPSFVPPPPPGAFTDSAQRPAEPLRAAPDAYAKFKPGIITLRPLTFGQILDGGIKALRHNPKVMLGLNGVVALVATIALFAFGFSYFASSMTFDPASTESPYTPGSIVSFVVGAFVSSLLLTVVTALTSISVGKSVIGVVVPPGEAWTAAMRRMPSVLGLTLLMSGAALVGYGVAVVIVVLAAQVSPALAVVLGIILFLATISAVFWLGIKLSLTIPAAVLERVRPIKAMKRSWSLTTGRFWMILAVLLVATIITSVIQQVLTAPVAVIMPLLAFNSSEPPEFLIIVLLAIASYLGVLLSTVFVASVTAIVYTDQRMRREGFDLVLSQAAERR